MVADRGRIPAEVRTAWQAAHSDDTSAPEAGKRSRRTASTSPAGDRKSHVPPGAVPAEAVPAEEVTAAPTRDNNTQGNAADGALVADAADLRDRVHRLEEQVAALSARLQALADQPKRSALLRRRAGRT